MAAAYDAWVAAKHKVGYMPSAVLLHFDMQALLNMCIMA